MQRHMGCGTDKVYVCVPIQAEMWRVDTGQSFDVYGIQMKVHMNMAILLLS
jgi:hypothetical protein